ncbi:hypothetical protein OIO90_002293 [Microbotryomycetes sp. JL221]|nr:hypothetical protein OIO90_002293 [Microbotryomycetes sp. JL221]
MTTHSLETTNRLLSRSLVGPSRHRHARTSSIVSWSPATTLPPPPAQQQQHQVNPQQHTLYVDDQQHPVWTGQDRLGDEEQATTSTHVNPHDDDDDDDNKLGSSTNAMHDWFKRRWRSTRLATSSSLINKIRIIMTTLTLFIFTFYIITFVIQKQTQREFKKGQINNNNLHNQHYYQRLSKFKNFNLGKDGPRLKTVTQPRQSHVIEMIKPVGNRKVEPTKQKQKQQQTKSTIKKMKEIKKSNKRGPLPPQLDPKQQAQDLKLRDELLAARFEIRRNERYNVHEHVKQMENELNNIDSIDQNKGDQVTDDDDDDEQEFQKSVYQDSSLNRHDRLESEDQDQDEPDQDEQEAARHESWRDQHDQWREGALEDEGDNHDDDDIEYDLNQHRQPPELENEDWEHDDDDVNDQKRESQLDMDDEHERDPRQAQSDNDNSRSDERRLEVETSDKDDSDADGDNDDDDDDDGDHDPLGPPPDDEDFNPTRLKAKQPHKLAKVDDDLLHPDLDLIERYDMLIENDQGSLISSTEHEWFKQAKQLELVRQNYIETLINSDEFDQTSRIDLPRLLRPRLRSNRVRTNKMRQVLDRVWPHRFRQRKVGLEDDE